MTVEAIQPFALFSDKKKTVYFRAPSVADYRAFVGMSERLEEMVTTQYLNNLQIASKYEDGKVLDSAQWTAEDRRTALYWIYINTHTDTTIFQEYECQQCGATHTRHLDLIELGDFIVEPTRPMIEKLDVEGVRSGFIKPLRGYAVEHIEQLRNYRDDFAEDTPDWCVAHADLRLHETAWALSFKDEDKTLTDEEREELRYNYLLTLEAEKTFKTLAATVRKALMDMRHGLMTEYLDGEIKLVTPHCYCPNTKEGDEKVKTILLLPFLYHRFFPAL